MAIKYWEFEDAPLKEKLKNVNVREIAKIFFDNETEAYRFASLLLAVKKTEGLRLKDVDKGIPISTAKRYLDFAVSAGMLKHESNVYMLTDRFSRPFKNIATYVKAWMDTDAAEDLDIEFPSARKGARKMPEATEPQAPDAKTEENGPDTNSADEKEVT
jgi:hypothetical protein